VDLSPLHSSLETLSERVEALNLRFVEENREETSQSTRKEAISDWPSGPWEKLQSRLQEIHDDLLILPDTPLTMRMESLDERLLQWKTELSEAQAALEEKMLSNFSHNQTSTETEAERNRRETRQLLEEQQASLQTSLDSFSQQWSATLATLEAQQSQEPQHSNDTTAALAESAIHLDLKALQNRLDAQQEVLASWQETFMASLETSLSSLSGGQVILDNHVQEFHQALNPLHNSIQGLSQQFETLQELQEEQQKHLKQTQAALNSLAAQSQTENPQSALQTDSSTQELMFKTLESRVFGDEMVQRLTMTGLIALLAVGLMAVPEGLFGQWVFKKWLYVVPMLWTASGWFGLVTLQRRWDETLERAKALGRAFLDEDQEIFRGWMIKLSHRLLGLLLVFQLLLFFFF
jgi:chromosome segregation ATPase